MPALEAPDIRRRFWAAFLDSEVKSDGQVPGFSAWWDRADEWHRHQAMRYAHWAAIKIERDRRDVDECIAAGVAALREEMRFYIPPTREPDADPQAVRKFVAALSETFGWKDRPNPAESVAPKASIGRRDVDEASFHA